MSNHSRLTAALIALGLASTAHASATIVFPEQQQGPVSFVTGGIGIDEVDAMKQASSSYPLTLEMATAAGGPRDAYISMARVDIRDARGASVLRTTTDGPFLLVRLPPGTYNVAVDWSGIERQKTVTVDAQRHQHVMVEFPDVPGNH